MRPRPSEPRKSSVNRRVYLLTGVALFIGAGEARVPIRYGRGIPGISSDKSHFVSRRVHLRWQR
jgi:hypothetical protein